MGSNRQKTIGRPRAAERADVAALGLRMFLRDGYDETTMQDIADAAGISRPTLFRYFASKADIVWDRSDADPLELRDSLAGTDASAAPLDDLCAVLPRLLQYHARDLDLLRIQVTIIATVPAVRGHADARSWEWIAVMAEFVASRMGGASTDLIPQVMSRCVWSAGWTALAHWAEGTERRPDSALAASFDALRRGFVTPAFTSEDAASISR